MGRFLAAPWQRVIRAAYASHFPEGAEWPDSSPSQAKEVLGVYEQGKGSLATGDAPGNRP